MKLKTFSHFIILATLLAGCALPPQTGQAENYYPEPAYSREELAQLLAPVALYPDALLSQVLMGATYPVEVVEADRWLRGYTYLQGETLDLALTDQDWAPSVKSLCHFPLILALMSQRIGETTDLGNAFLAQEDEVMDMIQELRAAAYAQGHLYTTAQQRIVFDGPTIIIEPATPIIYVPYYDPYAVYGPWWYPDYPPYLWAPAGATIGFGISYWPGTHFSFTFVSWSRFDWHSRHIYIDVHRRPRYVRHDHWVEKPRWQHAPSHRRGVAYHDKSTALKYGQPFRGVPSRSDARNAPQHREQYRQADNPLPRSERQAVARPQTSPSRQSRAGMENPRISPEKHLESRPAPNRRSADEKPGRVVWKEAEPQKLPIQNVRPEKQPVKAIRNKFVQDKATEPFRPQQVTREQARPVGQPEIAHRNQSVRSNAAKPAPNQHVVKKQARSERQPVAAKTPKRQGTPRATPPSHGDRGQMQSSRDNVAGHSETVHKEQSRDAKDRVEKPDRENDADLKKQGGRTNGKNRIDRAPSRGREWE